MIEYGKITKREEINIASGIHSAPVVIYEQSVRVTNDLDVDALYHSLMDDMRCQKLTNPGVQIEQYPDSGKIKRVVKCWTEVV